TIAHAKVNLCRYSRKGSFRAGRCRWGGKRWRRLRWAAIRSEPDRRRRAHDSPPVLVDGRRWYFDLAARDGLGALRTTAASARRAEGARSAVGRRHHLSHGGARRAVAIRLGGGAEDIGRREPWFTERIGDGGTVVVARAVYPSRWTHLRNGQ